MPFDAWLTLGAVIATVALLATERFSAPVVILGSVTALMIAGVIDAELAFQGFSNPAPITVAALYVVAAAADKTGALELVTGRILRGIPPGRAGDRKALLRILAPTSASSALLNNTPIVAMVASGVAAWARRTGRSPSPFLMPISFAAILGGLMTLIGTSTNVVVSGLLQQFGHRGLGLFEIGAVGAPIALCGLIFLSLAGSRLVPRRRTPAESFAADPREFTVEMIVERQSPLAGRTVEEGQLRNLAGVFLVQVERDGRAIAPVSRDEVLVIGDRLTFAGNVGRVLDLQRMTGLRSAEEPHLSVARSDPRARLYQAVVAEGSRLAGSTLKEVGFRGRYGAAVLAIHRAGERVPSKLGTVVLRHGDVLLLLADPEFRTRSHEDRDFLVVAALDAQTPPRTEKLPLVGAIVGALLITVGTGVLDILEGALLSAFALVATKVLMPGEARNSVDLNVIVLIAASFGLGAAISESGLADELARLLIAPLSGLGDAGLLLGILIATMMLTELVTNNAAAVLMFPIALAVAAQAGLDVRPFAIAVAVGASASFLSPIGYQTNTMVYGMGGYRFFDFARLGAPLTAIVIVLSMVIIPRVWPF